ncbi:hypothetical protein AB0B66_08585 [Catellatospora sp. NPDC049111]|uniref:hypothetical protein n=1 Tax=Catellatospora sp. NPDC049111 TaxID=3155271 RepID=UPI0033C15F75
MFRFQVMADGPDPLTVHFEPLPWEVVVEPGDHILIEWPESFGSPGSICHEPGRLTILEPNFPLVDGRNWARVWDSSGKEITY